MCDVGIDRLSGRAFICGNKQHVILYNVMQSDKINTGALSAFYVRQTGRIVCTLSFLGLPASGCLPSFSRYLCDSMKENSSLVNFQYVIIQRLRE